ncbi:hypothetical protein L6164_015838 [Bauhinia variegata]|uniref:Uncharacterized protein n=1 Tax=Bauhinia variegata TaxID=167791 RepID=A0ACB9NMF1_BAUVA|nr:hypothetical protein L6164_015838 [Bauhinia variegata]
MDNHLEQSKSGDLNTLEVVGVVYPWLLPLEFVLGALVVVEDGVRSWVGVVCCEWGSVHWDYIVFKLPSFLCYLRGGGIGFHCLCDGVWNWSNRTLDTS